MEPGFDDHLRETWKAHVKVALSLAVDDAMLEAERLGLTPEETVAAVHSWLDVYIKPS